MSDKKSKMDDEGTKPGIVTPPSFVHKEVSMRCPDSRCKSTVAKVLVDSDSGNPTPFRVYQCAKCATSWTVAVGGGVSF